MEVIFLLYLFLLLLKLPEVWIRQTVKTLYHCTTLLPISRDLLSEALLINFPLNYVIFLFLGDYI